jgi:transcriptional regulator with XRE-family HTH domain
MASSVQFGAFFRMLREELGLSLSEFCRHHGFEKANISRLERGTTPPPRSKRVLEKYTKALHLQPGTDRWRQFISLVMAGRTPEHLRTEVRRGQGHRNWVTARRLEEWAGTQPASSMLPQLVRRLIRATASKLTRLEAPAGEQVQRPGWDGLATTLGRDEFVPQGLSVWEMGVDKDPSRKANSDFMKRLKKAAGITKRKTTFIFVTPRKWQTKADWAKKKTVLNHWKEVRVYDSATLEEWLERAPAVDAWLARQLGVRPDGVLDSDEYWANLAALTDPSFGPDIFLASRGEHLRQLDQWRAEPASALLLQARSPAEAMDFVVAAGNRPGVSNDFAARTLIVESRDAWRSLSIGDGGLLLLAHPSLVIEPELVAEAVRNGHHVILCTAGHQQTQVPRIELPRVSRLDLQRALEAAGLDHVRAASLSDRSGGSLTVLKRISARFGGTATPEWSRPPASQAIAPFLLAGSWTDALGDQRVLEKLTGLPYAEVVRQGEHWAQVHDPLLNRALSRWDLVSRDDSWLLASNAVNDRLLRLFQQEALEVLGEPDPAWDLPREKRRYANLFGKGCKHSYLLRQGISETLALLGARPPGSKRLSIDPGGLAVVAVRALLGTADWKRWASLSSELPLLAEAAPDEFLRATERDLGQKSPALKKLFSQPTDPMFDRAPHTGVLWALEGLAWSTEHLPRVARVLARLGELAGSTNQGNNPLVSLVQTFTPWYPQTTASAEARVKIVTAVAKSESTKQTGWNLLLRLLPTRSGAVGHNRRPAFRGWALTWVEGASTADRVYQYEAYSMLAVELAAADTVRLTQLIGVIENLPASAQAQFLNALKSLEVTALSTESRRNLADAVRQKVKLHRRFADTDWALPENVLRDLEAARGRLEPDDVVARNLWLFADFWRVHLEIGATTPEEVVERRAKALAEVRGELGWDGIICLAQQAPSPRDVGFALGQSATLGDDGRVLPHLLKSKQPGLAEFAQAFVDGRHRVRGWAWVNRGRRKGWTRDQLTAFALALSSERQTWELVRKCGKAVERRYWAETKRPCLSDDSADVSHLCTMLGSAGRSHDAVRQLTMSRHRGVKLGPDVTMAVLKGGLEAATNTDAVDALGEVHYEVKDLIRELQSLVEADDARVQAGDVAGLEWGFLALLDGHPVWPTTLHTLMGRDPKFFVDLIGLIFRRADQPKKKRRKLTPAEQARIQQAYRLLGSWTTIPGTRPDRIIDEAVLRNWVRAVQDLAEGATVAEMCDQRMGTLLAHAPGEGAESWPCIPVRNVIEDYGSEAFVDGFEVGILNNRGAYMKMPTEGGKQEQTLAETYLGWARACEIEWPKTAAALRRVGQQYLAEGRREDVVAENR